MCLREYGQADLARQSTLMRDAAKSMPSAGDDTSAGGTAQMLAAMAKSLRAELMRRPGAPPATSRDLADVVELVELLAEDIVDLAKLAEGK